MEELIKEIENIAEKITMYSQTGLEHAQANLFDIANQLRELEGLPAREDENAN